VREQMKAALTSRGEFHPCGVHMLADKKGLGKVIRPLTTFSSLRVFRMFSRCVVQGVASTRSGCMKYLPVPPLRSSTRP